MNKCRTGAIILTRRHGKAACKGIDRLCETDYADSQYSARSSDDEEAKEKWKARKVEKGGGTASTSDAVAVRRKRWISPLVQCLCDEPTIF